MVAFVSSHPPAEPVTRSKNRAGDFFWPVGDRAGSDRLGIETASGKNDRFSYDACRGPSLAQGGEEITVGFYGGSNEEADAFRGQLERRGIDPNRIHRVRNAEEIEAKLALYAEMDGVVVRNIVIADHGNVGMQGITGYGNLTVEDFAQFSEYLQPGGNIMLTGCKVAGNPTENSFGIYQMRRIAEETGMSVSGYSGTRYYLGPFAWGGLKHVTVQPDGSFNVKSRSLIGGGAKK